MSNAQVFALVDWAAGAGIAGHSMGGQATAIAASSACTKQWGVRAAVMHHPASGDINMFTNATEYNAGVNFSVPMAGFTSSGDTVCARGKLM